MRYGNIEWRAGIAIQFNCLLAPIFFICVVICAIGIFFLSLYVGVGDGDLVVRDGAHRVVGWRPLGSGRRRFRCPPSRWRVEAHVVGRGDLVAQDGDRSFVLLFRLVNVGAVELDGLLPCAARRRGCPVAVFLDGDHRYLAPLRTLLRLVWMGSWSSTLSKVHRCFSAASKTALAVV